MEANKELLKKRLWLDETEAADIAYFFNKYGIGKMTELKIEYEDEFHFELSIIDENKNSFYASINKRFGLDLIQEGDSSGRVLFSALSVHLTPEALEAYQKGIEEAEQKRLAESGNGNTAIADNSQNNEGAENDKSANVNNSTGVSSATDTANIKPNGN
ncbi:MAG: hypothetical protein LBG97_07375 [Coriobacteriales bacterium]|jgi:hypothetical protein|nr:hypothetical protein [Coriobacteriales bacterium]